jgi:hypothetical protein
MPTAAPDRYNYLVSRRGIICGRHPKKGEKVTINRSDGNGLVTVSNDGNQWSMQVALAFVFDEQHKSFYL